MGILIAGILIWIAAHFFKRIAPRQRILLEARFESGAKAMVAATILLSVVVMVIGYKRADFIVLYDPPSWLRHVNNLMMLGAIMLFGMGSSKGRMRSWLRHPMLTGFCVWAVAHLMVNGDLASVILFGAMLAWALAEIIVINATKHDWTRRKPGTVVGDIRLFVVSLVLFVVIGLLHGWLGPTPFGG